MLWYYPTFEYSTEIDTILLRSDLNLIRYRIEDLLTPHY